MTDYLCLLYPYIQSSRVSFIGVNLFMVSAESVWENYNHGEVVTHTVPVSMIAKDNSKLLWSGFNQLR